jgi:hypothetical protein
MSGKGGTSLQPPSPQNRACESSPHTAQATCPEDPSSPRLPTVPKWGPPLGSVC